MCQRFLTDVALYIFLIQGLYYSYYKTIIEAPTFLNGLYMIMNDRLTEYPLIINTLKRFNLYPEVRCVDIFVCHLTNFWSHAYYFTWNSIKNMILTLLIVSSFLNPLQVLLASWYRAYTGFMEFFGIPTKMCWSINRGEGLDPVESCEGATMCFYSPPE